MHPSDLQPHVKKKKPQWGTQRFWVLQQFFEKILLSKILENSRSKVEIASLSHNTQKRVQTVFSRNFQKHRCYLSGPEMRREDIEQLLRKHESVVAQKASPCTAPGLWSAVLYYVHKLFYVQISFKISLPQLKVYSPVHSLILPSCQQVSPRVCSPDICLWFQVNLS